MDKHNNQVSIDRDNVTLRFDEMEPVDIPRSALRTRRRLIDWIYRLTGWPGMNPRRPCRFAIAERLVRMNVSGNSASSPHMQNGVVSVRFGPIDFFREDETGALSAAHLKSTGFGHLGGGVIGWRWVRELCLHRTMTRANRSGDAGFKT